MQAPRDPARRDPWAQSVARALTPRSLAPAFAGERDLSDPSIWQESIWRSQRRREAIERQLNFGPISGKRVAVPLAMLAAGLMVRDAASSGSDGLATFVPTASASGSVGAKRVAHRVERVKPATVAARHVAAAPAKPTTARAAAPARSKPPK